MQRVQHGEVVRPAECNGPAFTGGDEKRAGGVEGKDGERLACVDGRDGRLRVPVAYGERGRGGERGMLTQEGRYW